MATGSTTLYSNGGTSKDYVNNVESINISQPMACGDDWAVTVTASHLYYPTENPSQPYALVISGAGYVGGMVYTPMPTVTPIPTAMPTVTPIPTAKPSRKPTAKPTARPIAKPTTPTASPSISRRPTSPTPDNDDSNAKSDSNDDDNGAALALGLGLGLGLPLGVGLCVFLIFYVIRMLGQRSPASLQKETNSTMELPAFVSAVPEGVDHERVMNPLTFDT